MSLVAKQRLQIFNAAKSLQTPADICSPSCTCPQDLATACSCDQASRGPSLYSLSSGKDFTIQNRDLNRTAKSLQTPADICSPSCTCPQDLATACSCDLASRGPSLYSLSSGKDFTIQNRDLNRT